ncbi:MAG: homoserine dehydrogenase [Ktedonobacterales bacterium]
MHLRLASLGFGNVGRALAQMLAEKADELQQGYDLTLSFTGIYTRSAGAVVWPEGVSAREVAAMERPPADRQHGTGQTTSDALDFIRNVPADVVLELTTLNPQSGQPAIEHIRAALSAGKHVVTANKGPIAYAYRELRELAREHGVALRFESTVMDGTPIFRMAEAALPATTISGFRGLLNSTSNYVLDRMAHGETLEQAIAGAQRLGVAEANPSNDLEGWDASVKATVLANVLMDADLRPTDVQREGLGAEAMRQAEAERQPGQTLKQVVEASRDGEAVSARVRLMALPESDLLAHLSGMEAALLLHTDTMQDLTLIEGEGGPGQTAFGVVADLVTIAGDVRKGS